MGPEKKKTLTAKTKFTLHLLPRDFVLERAKTVGKPEFVPLERFQVLREREIHATRTVSLVDMMKGKTRDIGAASYAWERPGEPDPDGERLLQHAKFLQENPDVKYMFVDYNCVPQEWLECMNNRGATKSP